MTFQSSPSPEAGCYWELDILQSVLVVSILTQPGGRVLHYGCDYRCYHQYVSILTQPGGRVLRFIGSSFPKSQKFQSSPSPEAGCYGRVTRDQPISCAFQSSPSPEAGCYFFRNPPTDGFRGFNPHPARRPGATPTVIARPVTSWGFNPHPARRPGAT